MGTVGALVGGVGAGVGVDGAGPSHLKQKSSPVQSKSVLHALEGERFVHAAVLALPQKEPPAAGVGAGVALQVLAHWSCVSKAPSDVCAHPVLSPLVMHPHWSCGVGAGVVGPGVGAGVVGAGVR